jgi:predicted DNA-binding transcriptional regulator AlpA
MSYPALIDITTLKARLGIGGSATVYRRIKDDPHFPRPIKLGKLTRFIDAEVGQYIEHLAESREARTEADPTAA